MIYLGLAFILIVFAQFLAGFFSYWVVRICKLTEEEDEKTIDMVAFLLGVFWSAVGLFLLNKYGIAVVN